MRADLREIGGRARLRIARASRMIGGEGAFGGMVMRWVKWKAAVLAAMLAFGFSGAAEAQHTGTRLGKNIETRDLPKAMQVMAECAIRRREPMVRSWLNTLPGSVEEDRLFDKELGDLGLCLDDRLLVVDGQTIVAEARMIRGPFALALARRELKANAAPPTVAKDTPWFTAKLASLTANAAIDRLSLGLQDFGHCVAATDWSNARALVLSAESSPEQKQAMAGLMPSLGPCLSSDVELKLTPANLRTALAEPMVHILAGAGGSITASR